MALTQDPANLITDPLALRFMTGEQMGYMPEAQYLTPSEYGAFRTLPGPQGHNYLHQDPGFLQSLLIKSRGSLGFMPTYTFNTYNPAVNLQQYMYHMRTRSDDSLMAGVGVGADIAASMGVGMLLGGVPGLAAGMLMPDISKPMLDRIRDMRGIQNMSMSKIVGGADVNQITGAGFNAASARSLDSFLRSSSAGDALLKQGDWRKLLQLGIEHGQFDYAGNADQYKDALKKLRKSITTVMEVAGSTDFKDIMKEYKRMRTMGADLSEYTNIMRKEDMYSRVTGLSHADMVNTYGQQGALIYQQAGLTGYQGSLQAMHNAASITLMQRTGLLSPGALSRYGGISGLAQAMTQQDATAQNRIADFMLPYFMKEDASGLDDSASFADLLNSNDPLGMVGRAGGRKTRTLKQRLAFDRNRGDLMQHLQERYGQNNITMFSAYLAGVQGSNRMLKGAEALEFGLRVGYGYDPNIAHLKTQAFLSSDFREQEERELQLARRKQREEQELTDSPFRKLALSLDKTFTRWGENIFGGMANWYAGWSERRANHAEGYYDTGNIARLSPHQLEMLKRGSYGHEFGGINDSNLEMGFVSAQFESPKDGISQIAYDSGGGTSYGKWQLSSKQGSYGEWLDDLEAEGGEAAEIAKRLRAVGDFNTGGTTGAQVDAYKREAAANPELFERTQRASLMKRKYKPAFNMLASDSLRDMINKDRSLQEMLFSTAVQHGEGGAKNIFNKVYQEGMSRNELIHAVYKERERVFPDTAKRYREEMQVVLGLNLGLGSASEKDLVSAMSTSVRNYTNYAIKRGVKYNMPSEKNPDKRRSVKAGATDCSGWIMESGVKMMDEVNRQMGAEVFSKKDKADLKSAGTAANIIKIFSEKTGGNLLNNAQLAPDKVRAGMYIGMDTGNEGWDAGRFKGIDHIIQTVLGADGRMMVSQSSSSGNGVTLTPYEEWYAKWNKKASLFGVDMAQAADTSKIGYAAAPEDYRKRWDDEVAQFYEQMSGEVAQAYNELHDANGSPLVGGADYTSVTSLHQILGRMDSGADIKNGAVDYKQVSSLLSEVSGTKVDSGLTLRDAIKKNGSASSLKKIASEEDVKEYVRAVLDDIPDLSDKDKEKALNDAAFRASVVSASVQTLSPEDAKEIYGVYLSRARKKEESNWGAALNATEGAYLKHIDDALEIALPGFDNLDSRYGQAKKEIRERAFKGENSTPFVINAARLSMLKELATDKNAGIEYEKEFRIEAIRHGFDDKWVNEQLKNPNALTLEDLKSSKDYNAIFGSLNEKDMSNARLIGEGMRERHTRIPGSARLVNDRYNENLSKKDGIVTRQQAAYMTAQDVVLAGKIAEQFGMRPEELLTSGGIEKAHWLKDKKTVSPEIRDIITKAYEKHQRYLKTHKAEDRLKYRDLVSIRHTRRNSSDEYTWAAQNQNRVGIYLSSQMSQEAQRAASPVEEQKKVDDPSTSGGTVLDKETVLRLNRTLEELRAQMKQVELALTK